MRVIRPAITLADRWRASVIALLLLVVGWTAVLQLVLLPHGSGPAAWLMAISAVLGNVAGGALFLRAWRLGRRHPADPADDLVRLLRPAFDESYTLVVGPRLPGLRRELAAVLIGPAGVRAIISRRWRGNYRVRGRNWQYNTHSKLGWINCYSNPSLEADEMADLVAAWARTALDDPGLVVTPVIAFPQGYSRIILEEPATEVLTADNAPWWANSIGRVQRLDPQRAARVLRAVLDAGEALMPGDERATRPRGAGRG